MSETARSTGGAAHPAGRAQAGAPRRGRPWRNWSGSARAHPVLTATPRSVDEVIAAVQVARDRGLTVKAVGAGHSFTPIAATDGIQLDLAALSGIRAVDGNLVTLGAGTPLHRLPALLSPLGLAMPNLGDIDRQTIAGATATGTHGTGLAFGGLATRIRAVTMVTAAGELLTVSDPVRLPAVALGLGALGLLVDVTLELAPAFALHGLERPMPTAEVLERWPELIRDSDHFEFYVWPHTETSLTKLNTRLPADTVLDPPSGFEQWLTDRTENQVFTASLGLSTAIPPLVGPLNRLGVRLTGDREYTDRSQAVFTSLRTTRFNEQEYGIPVAAVPDAIHAILDLIRARGWRISFPTEVRAAAADDLMLSTAAGRDTGYIAVHRWHRQDPTVYFREVEQVLTDFGARPHWGKLHTRDSAYLSTVYPRFGEFLAVRDQLDPDRLFTNPYLDRVLGA